MPLSKEKKKAYFEKLSRFLNTYSRLFVVSADHVGSNQLAKIRISLRGKADILFGKNTMMRRGFKLFLAEKPNHPFASLLPYVSGNIGFVFSNGDLPEVRDLLLANVIPAPARVGLIAPVNVVVPPGPTGCDPGQTAFFQALNIATKIVKGQIEIVSEVPLIPKGGMVEPGHAALLQKLNIKPFSYGLKIVIVYESGSLFAPEILDLSESDVASKFLRAVSTISAFSLGLSYPTLASLRYSVAGAFAKVLALSLAVNAPVKQTQIYFDYLADPSKFAALAAAPSAGGGGGPAVAAAAEAEPEAPAEEVDMGAGDLFGGGGGGGGDY